MFDQPITRPRSGVRARGPLVLLIEDEEPLRELHAAELASAGFMVLEAPDGASGIEKALQFGPHAVVLDLLPSVATGALDGLKVARRLRAHERTQDVALIALAGTASPRFEELALAAGCDVLLRKPVSSAALVGELVRQLATRTRTASDVDLSRLARGR
jgi:CheY-like chemotaxis protein